MKTRLVQFTLTIPIEFEGPDSELVSNIDNIVNSNIIKDSIDNNPLSEVFEITILNGETTECPECENLTSKLELESNDGICRNCWNIENDIDYDWTDDYEEPTALS